MGNLRLHNALKASYLFIYHTDNKIKLIYYTETKLKLIYFKDNKLKLELIYFNK